MKIINKIEFKSVCIIIISSIILSVGYNLISDFGINFIRQEKMIMESDSTKLIDILDDSELNNRATKQLIFINLKLALKLYREKNVIFIDARDKWDFAEGHVKNAINVPEYMFEKTHPIIDTLSRSKQLVVYCGAEDCGLSSKLAIKLIKLGFKNTFVFKGGWEEWNNNNLPSSTEKLESEK